MAITTDPIWRNLLFRFVASIPSRGCCCLTEPIFGVISWGLAGLSANTGSCSRSLVFSSSSLACREIRFFSWFNLFSYGCPVKEILFGLAPRVSWSLCWLLRVSPCTKFAFWPFALNVGLDPLRLWSEVSSLPRGFRDCLHSATARTPSRNEGIVCLLNELIGLGLASFPCPSIKQGRLKRLCVDLGIVLNLSRLSNKLVLAKEIRRSSLSI